MTPTETHLPFDEEDDRKPLKVWKHEGIYCAVYKGPAFGAINGYVLIPKGHPWRELQNYHDLPVTKGRELTYGWRHVDEFVWEKDGKIHTRPAHTISGEDVNWWVGFDTAHYMDLDHDAQMKEFEKARTTGNYVAAMKADIWKWTIEDVVRWTDEIAEEVAEAATVADLNEARRKRASGQ